MHRFVCFRACIVRWGDARFCRLCLGLFLIDCIAYVWLGLWY